MRGIAEEVRIGGQLAFAVVLLALRPSAPAPAPAPKPTPVQHHFVPLAIPIPIPIAIRVAEPPPTTHKPTACPSVVREAPAANPKHFPEDVTRVSVALTNARWLAAWNDKHVFVSRDGGATFTRTLDGPGAVIDVAFDCFGHPIVLRDNARVGIRDDRDRWARVPGLRGDDGDLNNLIGGGPDVVVLGVTSEADSQMGRLAITRDLGTSWSFRDLSPYYEGRNASGHQLADGRIRVALSFVDCMHDPMYWYAIDGERIVEDDLTVAPGKLYVHGDIAYASTQWRRMNREWRDIEGLPTDVDVHLMGAVPRAIAGNVVYRLRDGVATPLRPWPNGVEPLAVDLAGRIWGRDKSTLVVIDGHAAPIPPTTCCSNE